MSDFKAAVAVLLAHEGCVYTNIPNDLGGPTKYGITLSFLRSTDLNRRFTADDVKNLTQEQAEDLYEIYWWRKLGLDKLSSKKVALCLLDQCVLRGPNGPIKAAQRSVGATADGVLGPLSTAALNAANENGVALDIIANSLTNYARIVANDHTQSMFLQGWTNRCVDLLNQCFR